jgi:uncharacterized protein
MSYEQYLPPTLKQDDLAAVVGLVSDTHMPLRRRTLPPILFEVLHGVDFLLHAGDVGELWALDQLSAIAPVFAVHGNDDTEDAQRELPFQQIIAIASQRILLWHSHFLNWEEEMAFRKDDDLYRSLQRSADQARRAGAKVVVFGHWHIPLVYRTNGVEEILIINPGALASGNEFTRMLHNTVAILFVEKSGQCHVVHIDLAAPDAPYQPIVDWDAGFRVAANQFEQLIITPDLRDAAHTLRANLTLAEFHAIRPLVAELAHPIWESGEGQLTLAAVEDAIMNSTALSPELHARVHEALQAWRQSR